MPLTHRKLKKVQKDWDRSLALLSQQDAGTFQGDPDQPITLFSFTADAIVRNQISDPQHLSMLYSLIDYLKAEGNVSPGQPLDDGMDAAIEAAMDYADPLERALLALARYELRQQRASA